MDTRFLRQQDAVNMDRLPISLIGAGSIGSTTALFLTKMGIGGVRVFDADCVENHNWSNQMYRGDDVGKPKVEALREMIEAFGGNSIDAIVARYMDQPLSEIVISGVDSMKSRKTIWRAIRESSEVRLYLDARMGLETLAVYAVKPQVKQDRVSYAKSLCSDTEALAEPCTARSVCYTPLMASAVLCNLVKRYVNDEVIPSRVVLDFATWSLIV